MSIIEIKAKIKDLDESMARIAKTQPFNLRLYQEVERDKMYFKNKLEAEIQRNDGPRRVYAHEYSTYVASVKPSYR